MPKVEYVVPTQSSHVDLSAAGAEPAPHDSHAVWSVLAALPFSSQAVHSVVPVLTLPAGHAVQSSAEEQSAGLQTPSTTHEVPEGHEYGVRHLDLPFAMTLGAGQT